MPRKKLLIGESKIEVVDIVPALGRAAKVKLELPESMVCVDQRTTQHGWSATFAYFGVTCVLREAERGTLECVADWVPARSGRVRTGTHIKSEAIEWAAERMKDVHLRKLERGGDGESPAGGSLILSDAVGLIRQRNLLPGAEGSKSRTHHEFMLDLSLAVWGGYTEVDLLSNAHVRRMYAMRVLPRYLKDPSEVLPFKWPSHLSHRTPPQRVKPQTVQKNLEDIRTLLGKLVGETNDKGEKYVTAPPMAGLELGNHTSEKRDVAGPWRYGWVWNAADSAVEIIREEGFEYEEDRWYDRNGPGEWRTYHRTQVFPNIVPGMLRYMLALQVGHPTRPRGIRNLAMEDVARSRPELVSLIQSLELLKSDETIPVEWVNHWPHGGAAYRRRFSKNDTERLVPFSADLAIEHDLYVGRRKKWLASLGVESPWLFPSPRDPEQAISEKDAGYLLACGEQVARELVEAAGLNPDEIVPEFDDTAWYAYRRYWKTNRNSMGWEANRNAAYVGDWTTNTGQIADTIYARFSPQLILAVVEGKTLVEAISDEEAIKEAKEAARIRPGLGGDSTDIRAMVSHEAA